MITHHITSDPIRTDCARSPLEAGQYSRDWMKVTCADCLTRRPHKPINNARRELADLLYEEGAYCGNCDYESRCGECEEVLGRYADALLAEGYRKHRTITTTEELEALPNGAVIRDAGTFVYEKIPTAFDTPWAAGSMHRPNRCVQLPATVLYEPGGSDV
jgi:hypothetical protein